MTRRRLDGVGAKGSGGVTHPSASGRGGARPPGRRRGARVRLRARLARRRTRFRAISGRGGAGRAPRVRFGVRGGIGVGSRCPGTWPRGISSRGSRGPRGPSPGPRSRPRRRRSRTGRAWRGRSRRARAREGRAGRAAARPPPGRPRRRLRFSRTRHRVARRAEARREAAGAPRPGSRARPRPPRACRGGPRSTRGAGPCPCARKSWRGTPSRRARGPPSSACRSRRARNSNASRRREPPRARARRGKRRPRRRARVRRRALAFARNARGRRAAARACGALCARGGRPRAGPGGGGCLEARRDRRAARVSNRRPRGWLAREARLRVFFARAEVSRTTRRDWSSEKIPNAFASLPSALAAKVSHIFRDVPTFARGTGGRADAVGDVGLRALAAPLDPFVRALPGRARTPARSRPSGASPPNAPLVGPRPPWNGSRWRRESAPFPTPAAAPVAPPAPAT